MRTKYKILLLVSLVVVMIVSVRALLFYSNSRQEVVVEQSEPSAAEQQNTEPKPSLSLLDNFVPFSSPKAPSFVALINNANDVKIDLHYEGDFTGSSWSWGRESAFYTPEGSDEEFLSLSKLKDREGQYAYGPEYHSLFTSQESHLYQGTPIYLLNLNSQYSVSYVGFQINNLDLIGELRIEFGIDYTGGFGYFDKAESSLFDKIFGVETAYACGPGIYLRRIGDSELNFVEEAEGIAWYQLEEPVALHDLNLNYCDDPPEPRPNYCNNEASDPAECWNYCYYNASIPSLANGNLRMHVFYKPNNKEGLLKIQIVNLILSDLTGEYYQPIMGDNFDHYYRAYLH